MADTFRMSGEFTYLADAGFFTECRSGLRLPVAQEKEQLGAGADLRTVRSAAGAPLLVTLDGRLAHRPKMEGSGERKARGRALRPPGPASTALRARRRRRWRNFCG